MILENNLPPVCIFDNEANAAVTCGGLAELGGWALAPESGQRRPDPVRSTGLFAQRLRGAGKSVEQQVTAAFPRRASVAGT